MSLEGQGSALCSVHTGTQATTELSAPCRVMVSDGVDEESGSAIPRGR